MHDRWLANHAEPASRAAAVFAASHAPRSFLSFPRGVPLLASLEHLRPRPALQSFRLRFHAGQRSWGPL